MNSIISTGYLLQNDKLSVSKQKDYLGKLQYSSQVLLETLNNILDFSKLGAKKMPLELSNFKLEEVIKNIQPMFAAQIEKKQLFFSIKADDSLQLCLKGDSFKLGQILLNLISNAVKFTHHGGIVLEINKIKQKKKQVAIKFSVRDTGIGISKQHQKNLFLPFAQANLATSKEHNGTGLGLSISQQLLQLMGSKIKVESSLNRGSVFSFKVKFELIDSQKIADKTEQQSPLKLVQTPELENKTILVIEDDELNQFFIKELLIGFGVNKIIIAESAEKGLKYLAHDKINIVLLDIQMPEMDGYEAARIIRSNPEWKNLTIICLTAHIGENEHRKIIKAGANGVISKPIDPDLLCQTLLKWL